MNVNFGFKISTRNQSVYSGHAIITIIMYVSKPFLEKIILQRKKKKRKKRLPISILSAGEMR